MIYYIILYERVKPKECVPSAPWACIKGCNLSNQSMESFILSILFLSLSLTTRYRALCLFTERTTRTQNSPTLASWGIRREGKSRRRTRQELGAIAEEQNHRTRRELSPRNQKLDENSSQTSETVRTNSVHLVWLNQMVECNNIILLCIYV